MSYMVKVWVIFNGEEPLLWYKVCIMKFLYGSLVYDPWILWRCSQIIVWCFSEFDWYLYTYIYIFKIWYYYVLKGLNRKDVGT